MVAPMIQGDGGGASAQAVEEMGKDRRRFRRAAVDLPGRYMLEDGGEYPCVCTDISIGGVRLSGPQSGPWGSRVVAYIEAIGRLEGYIVRRATGWFALETRSTLRKGERVQERIAMILETLEQEMEDRREDPRRWQAREASLSTSDGLRHRVEITDVSRVGAALLTGAELSLDQSVCLDDRRARVARVFPGGAALKFERGRRV
jgi:hypothetical protein